MGLKANHFIEKSILGAAAFFKDSLFAEEYASRRAFLQSLDPRIKTVSFAVFILTVLFLKEMVPVLLLYFFVLFLAVISKIELVYFLKRTWIFIPLFSLFIAIPALFSVFSPGEALFSFNLFHATLTITRQGVASASLFVSRVITSVSIVVLLSLTTKHARLLRALRVFGIPQVFIMTITMCYRYMYLFAKILEETYVALKSRVGTAVYSGHGQKIVSWNVANLWRRSFYLHKDVYGAMVSRGYAGQARAADDLKLRARDWMWLAASITVSTILILSRLGSG